MEKAQKLIDLFKNRDSLDNLKAYVSKDNLPNDATHIKVTGDVIARKTKRPSKNNSPNFMMVLRRGKWVKGNMYQSYLDSGEYVLLDDVRKLLENCND